MCSKLIFDIIFNITYLILSNSSIETVENDVK